MKSKLVFGREPAVWLGLVAVALQFFSAFVVEVSDGGQAVLNAAVAAGFGLIVAWKVSDGTIAALTGFAQAALAAGMHFGLDWSAGKQAAAMAFVTVVAQSFVRTQVTAPVSAAAVGKPAPVASV